jgi:hypothetical protein
MKYALVLFIIGLLIYGVEERAKRAHNEGFKLGMHYALKSDPPSEQLEMTCAGLWVGKQNQKMWNKQNAR